MLQKMVSLVLACFLFTSVWAAPVVASTQATKEEEHVRKVKAKVMKLGTGTKARVEVKLKDGSKLKGYISEINEDHFVVTQLTRSLQTLVTSVPAADLPALAQEINYVMIVVDGMGGHAAGEVASEMAVQIVQRELTGIRDLETNGVDRQVTEALKSANRKIHERTLIEVDKQGMGTTVSVLIIAGRRYLIGQVGDSRVYLLRDGALTQLTKLTRP